MKLIRGSYACLVGIFGMIAVSVLTVVAFFFALYARTDLPNPVLSEFGGKLAGGVVTTVSCALFTVWTFVFSAYVLMSALKKNSIDKPLRLIGRMLFLYAAVMAFLAVFYRPGSESPALLVLRLLKCLPLVALGVCLVFLTKARPAFKGPSMILCILCALCLIPGYGFYKRFGYEGQIAKVHANGYTALLLYTIALALFFVCLCILIGGTEKRDRSKKKK